MVTANIPQLYNYFVGRNYTNQWMLSEIFSTHWKKNPAATLATLILLSYTKLLQAVINILSFTILKYPNGSQKAVWLPDANVQFLEVKHVPLFLVALTLVSLGLAYTVLLITWQWLLKLPETRITCSWIRSAKLNSFIDTYHVPYNAKYHY